MKRKIVSVLVCAAMVATMAVGCGSSSTDTSSDAAATTEDAAAEEDAAATEDAAAEEDAAATDDAAAADGELIKVGIINNDPGEPIRSWETVSWKIFRG